MNVKKVILIRVYITLVVFVLIALAVVYQLAHIQFGEGKYWRSLADSTTTRFDTIEPVRGNIYSSDNKLLVTSLPIYEIRIDFKTEAWMDKQNYKQKIDSLSNKLSHFFGDKSPGEYKRILSSERNKKSRYFLLKRNVTHDQLTAIRNFPLFNAGRFKGGLVIIENSKRIKPFVMLAERTIGNTWTSKKGSRQGVGIEWAFNEYLSGQEGQKLFEKISGNTWIPVNSENDVEPEDGKDIITTIDVGIQDIAENALLSTLVKNNADNGCVIVMEVSTGYIKAIANLKKVPPDSYMENENFAVANATEPGSTFKLASAIILLEDGKVSLNDIVDTKNGKKQFFDRVMRDSDTNGYGKITFLEAFEKSSNVAFSTLVFDNYYNNPKEYFNGLNDLMLTAPMDIQLPGAASPYIIEPNSKFWNGTTLPWMSVGYALKISPLQLLTLYNAVANNGTMMKPIFVTEVAKTGKVYETFGPEVIRDKICSEKTLRLVQTMLKSVVESDKGTAHNIWTSNYQIAGKTGTSLIALQGSYADKQSKRKSYQASFAGYFPADNPKYSCIVVVTNPKNDVYYGAWVAAPVFREIADKLYVNNSKNYIPSYVQKPIDYTQLPVVTNSSTSELVTLSSVLGLNMKRDNYGSEWVTVMPEKDKFILVGKKIEKNIVPDVRGMVLSDAVYLLEGLGLKIYCEGYGKVRGQSVNPGSPLIPKSTIKLILG